MKFSVFAGALALFCNTVQAEALPEPQRTPVFSIDPIGPTFINPTLIGPTRLTLTIKPTLTLQPISSTCTASTIIKTSTITNTVTSISTITVKPITDCTNTTVYVVKTDTLFVTLPPVTVTNSTTITRTGTITATITKSCSSTTTNPCPELCAITKTYSDCVVDRSCVPTVTTTTTGCKCPVASCTSYREVSTCLTCPHLGTKTVGCSTASSPIFTIF